MVVGYVSRATSDSHTKLSLGLILHVFKVSWFIKDVGIKLNFLELSEESEECTHL